MQPKNDLSNHNDATTTKPASETNEYSHIKYQEERRILLASVAQSLSEIVRKMAEANEKMHGISERNREVEEVAQVWREGFARKY